MMRAGSLLTTCCGLAAIAILRTEPVHAQGALDAWNYNSTGAIGWHASNVDDAGFIVSMMPLGAFRVVASGQVIFDDFGPGDSYLPWTAYIISDARSFFGSAVEQGDAFTTPVGSSLNLDSISIALNNLTGPNIGMVTLREDAGGFPGDTLETWYRSNLPNFGLLAPPTVLTSVGTPLMGGATYWVIASVPDQAAIPEPSALAWLVTGVAGMAAVHLRRRHVSSSRPR